MSRLGKAFEAAHAEGRAAIVAYVMAGDPAGDAGFEYASAILDEADVLELGIPFSDPVADGPVIERAAVRALAAGHRVAETLGLCARLRADSDKPLVLMTYYNPVLRYGLERFARDAAEAGADGVILPDVPLEESGEPARVLAAHGLDLVQLASPATPKARLTRLAKATRGFLYVVSSFGVTGARKDLAPETRDVVQRAADACESEGAHLAVGFGVSEPRHVRELALAGAGGVVVGSAIVARIERGETPRQVAAFVRSLRDA
jgi:tryptophan synthase alpha chain